MNQEVAQLGNTVLRKCTFAKNRLKGLQPSHGLLALSDSAVLGEQ